MNTHKLTDDQKDLILVMINDFEEYIEKDNTDNGFDALIEFLTNTYNKGKYDNSLQEVLNSIRDYWLTNFYNEELSCWHAIKEVNDLN